MGFIYLIRNNINNKVYIGQTINSIATRWAQHKAEAKRGIPDVYFIRALRKYGCDNFTVEQLEECVDSALDEREQYYIKLFQSNNHNIGYNSTIGGNSNNCKFERQEIKQLWDKGYTVQEIAKQLQCTTATISTGLSAFNITEGERRSRAMAQCAQNKQKKILQYNLAGNLVATYNCVAEAAKAGYCSEGIIRQVCNHHLSTGGGYIWCHEDEPKTITELIEEIPLAKTKRSVEQYDLTGKLLHTYDSVTAAAEAVHKHPDSIRQAANGSNYHSGGYLWKYADDNSDINIKVAAYKQRKDYHKLAVNQYDKNGQFLYTFNSAAEAASALNKPSGGSSITKACRGKLKTAYGFIWTYATEEEMF